MSLFTLAWAGPSGATFGEIFVASCEVLARGVFAAGLTYTAHAGLWSLGAMMLGRIGPRSFSAQHRLWRIALAGGVLTTALALSGALPFLADGLSCRIADFLRASEPARGPLSGTLRASWRSSEPVLSLVPTAVEAAASARLGGASVAVLLGLIFALAAVVGLLGWIGAARAFVRELAHRRPSNDRRALARLRALVGERDHANEVRLSESSRSSCALVLGRREICVPVAWLDGLGDAELDGVLAHELAHLERGDGLLFPVLGLLRATLWFHPVVRWTTARLSQVAELAADERAARRTGDPLALARALTQVAAEVVAKRHGFVPAIVGAVSGGHRGALAFRVRQLVAEDLTAGDERREPSPLRRRALVVVLLSLGSLALPWRIPAARERQRMLAASAAAPSAQVAAPPREDLATTARELLAREHELRVRLQAARASLHSVTSSTETPPFIEALEQDLRHLHALQAWNEERLVAALDRGARPPRP